MNALNPVIPIGAQLVDALQAHERMSDRQARARSAELFELVGIEPRRLRSYSHQLSGGMRQRAVIAMALALNPEVLIMDEPTTALDVVVQRDILQQIQDLQAQFGFAILFITHDLSLLVSSLIESPSCMPASSSRSLPPMNCWKTRFIRIPSVS